MRRVVISLCLIWFAAFFLQQTVAAREALPQRVTLIAIPGLSFDHISGDAPYFRLLLEEGSLGAMNLRTAGPGTLANSYATLASGRRVSAPEKEPFYQVWEMAEDRPAISWVNERIGINPRAGAVYPALVSYGEKNRIDDKASPQQFMLGEVLNRAGKDTAVWGNADWGEEYERFAPFLTMDKYGRTRNAVIDDRTWTAAPGFPYGMKTDYDYLLQAVRESRAELRVVELGDLYRLQREAPHMTEKRRQHIEHRILEQMDHFVRELASWMASDEMLWIISPYIQPGAPKHKAQLAPVFCLGGGREGDTLYSPTTRRNGIVANIDLAPTMIRLLGASVPTRMDGQPMVVASGDAETFWSGLEQVVTVYKLRPFVIYAYALYQVMVLMIALGLLISKKGKHPAMLQVALLASALTPTLFLLFALVPTTFSFGMFLSLWAGVAFLAAVLLKKLPTVPLFLILGLSGSVPVVLDGLLGGRLIRQSFLGHDPIIGARYYGIGNEYMGVVLGAAILAVAAYLEWRQPAGRRPKVGAAFLFVGLVLYFASPFLGTNAGGALAASVGLGVAYARFFYTHWNLRSWLAFASIGFAGLVLLFIMNVFLDGNAPSHIGRAFNHLLSGDVAAIFDIVTRKLSTNIRLIKGSLWGKVFFISLLAMTVLIIQPMRGVRWLRTRYPYLFHGFTAILITAISALVVNDSGIVSAATAIVYVVIPLLIIVCRDWPAKAD